ncbi:MAG: hypothetical protein Q4E57_00365 [Eubacteriales bacterium]|nr:hypothetical protein [Eubacteriales bacterium]
MSGKRHEKFEITPVYAAYLAKFALRISIFTAILVLYITHRDWLGRFMVQPISFGITPIHILWAMFMLMMLGHIFPTDKLSMAILKQKAERFEPVEGYSELSLLRYVRGMNIRAWIVMLVWLSFNAIFGILYLAGIIDEGDLLMLTVFYFLCDYICIIIFCPFQTFIMKNKCCVNCRIYDWGHIMMFTPMLFIRNFFSWSLFFTSIVVMFRWEMIYALHSERFWEGSNKRLQCANCRDKTCLIKKKVGELVKK